MPQTKLIAVDSTLAMAPVDMSQDLIDAFSYTTTFAQAVARKVNKDPSTEVYFDAMTQEYQKIAWNVLQAVKVDYHQSQAKISPAGIVSSILNPYLTQEQQTALAGVLNAIQQPDCSINNFLTFWWNKGQTNANQSSLAFGSLFEEYGHPAISMIYYNFNFSAENWRSLFVEKDSADLSVHAYRLQMNLNMDLYNSYKQTLIERLSGKEADHIKNVDLDL